MFPTLNIGGLVFPTAGLLIILGAWLGLTLVERTAVRVQQNKVFMYGVAATAVFVGFVGARLTFVLEYWFAFSQNLLSIIWPLNTGYNVWGGLILGLIGGFFYARAKRLRPMPTLDALLPGIIFGLMVVSLADFAGGPGYGTLTAVPWGVAQFGVRRHPVQLYELLVGGLALLTWWRATRPGFYEVGRPFMLSTAVYSAGRLFVDAFRDNPVTIGDGYRVLQIVSLVILLRVLFQIGRMVQSTDSMQGQINLE
ncbi:prolipoprotein diacylglyceryl transferase [Candidatus Leptofilum sp.]|uniref:prolipoprotein diacylglyceryl transferase n=1 Tax=Candidatus Leptofilum sp. TaxID=3241576 RepID=UPI003B5C0D7D